MLWRKSPRALSHLYIHGTSLAYAVNDRINIYFTMQRVCLRDINALMLIFGLSRIHPENNPHCTFLFRDV